MPCAPSHTTQRASSGKDGKMTASLGSSAGQQREEGADSQSGWWFYFFLLGTRVQAGHSKSDLRHIQVCLITVKTLKLYNLSQSRDFKYTFNTWASKAGTAIKRSLNETKSKHQRWEFNRRTRSTADMSFPEYLAEDRGRFSKGVDEAHLLFPFFFALSLPCHTHALFLLWVGGAGGNVGRMEKKRKLSEVSWSLFLIKWFSCTIFSK